MTADAFTSVANRVQMIRNVSTPQQWNYMESGANPADLATREVTAKNLSSSQWLTEPDVLKEIHPTGVSSHTDVPLDEGDREVRREVHAFTSEMKVTKGLGSTRFSRFSTWSSLQRGLANLIVKAREFKIKQSAKQTPEENQQVTSTIPQRNNRPNLVTLPHFP